MVAPAVVPKSKPADIQVGHSFVQVGHRTTIATVGDQIERCTMTSGQCQLTEGEISTSQESRFMYSGIHCDLMMGIVGAALFWCSRAVTARRGAKKQLQTRAEEARAEYATSCHKLSEVDGKGKLSEATPCDEDSKDHVDVCGVTALHRAAAAGDLAATVALLEDGAYVDAREAWDETPLHMAARAGAPDVAEVLLDSGATLEAQNADDETPLLVAGRAGHEALCSMLLDRGATVADTSADDLPMTITAALLERMLELPSTAAELD